MANIFGDVQYSQVMGHVPTPGNSCPKTLGSSRAGTGSSRTPPQMPHLPHHWGSQCHHLQVCLKPYPGHETCTTPCPAPSMLLSSPAFRMVSSRKNNLLVVHDQTELHWMASITSGLPLTPATKTATGLLFYCSQNMESHKIHVPKHQPESHWLNLLGVLILNLWTTKRHPRRLRTPRSSMRPACAAQSWLGKGSPNSGFCPVQELVGLYSY